MIHAFKMNLTNQYILNIKMIDQSASKYYSEKRDNNAQDSGFDLYVPNKYVVPANAISYKIPLGISASIYQTNDSLNKLFQ